jgi:hypothetical protein
MSEPQPDQMPTSQVTGTTSPTDEAQTAPGTPPSPQDLDVSPHPYRPIVHADGAGGSVAGTWDAPADGWPGSPE